MYPDMTLWIHIEQTIPGGGPNKRERKKEISLFGLIFIE